jgi:hypothetical protein
MTTRATTEQITEAMHRAAQVAREHTRYPDRIAEFPRGVDDCEPVEDGWWHIGWIGVVGEPEEWDVLYDPEREEGRLRGDDTLRLTARVSWVNSVPLRRLVQRQLP